MSDITVTINPPNSTSVTIGGAISPHASTHAVGGSDSLSNYYYPQGNPSGYATSGDFATTGYVGNVSGAIVAQISFPQNVVFTTGAQNISGVKNFISRPTVGGTGVLLSGEASVVSTGYLTGYVSKLETGLFYPINNPSGYITGVNLSAYQTIVGSTGISGYLQTQISAINLSPLQTATGVLNTRVTSLESHTDEYYLRTNPSGYITGVDLSSYSTISYVTGVSGYLNGKISTLQTATGDLDNRSIQALFISGEGTKTITLLRGDGSTISTTFTDISGDFSAPSGYLQSQITTLNNQTGSYVTGLVVRPSQTGVFLTNETDPIFAASIAFGINSTLTGNWTTSYNKSVTGINVAGSTTKTITLYQRDGGNISASFTDSEGTGAGADFYIYSGSFDSGNGNLTLNRTGDNGTVIVPLDGRYSTVSNTTGVSGYLQSQISAINLTPLQVATGNLDVRVTYLESNTGLYVTGSVIRPSDTGAFYPRTNPSGYITGIDLSNYVTTPSLTGASGYLQSQISNLNGQTGSYVTGNVVRPSDTGAFLTTGAGDFRYVSQGATGSFITSEQTGLFYGASNPSGYITGVNLSSYATVVYTTGISGYLQTQISSLNSQTGSYITGSIIRPSDTGNFVTTSQTGLFYPASNPSGFITVVDLSSYQTVAASTGISGFLQTQISALNSATGNLNTRVSVIETQTGNFALKSATGAFLTTGAADARFYPLSSNPSSYLVAADISNLASTGYVTGVSGYLQSNINTLNFATGLLYPRSNPSGYITGVDLSSYALQSSVDSINAQSGQWITGYNKYVTGISIAGTDTKTLTIFRQDGTVLSANFTDLQGTGGSASGYVSLIGDENISGVKNFISRPTVGGTGVLLSGEIYPAIREIYIDAGAMLTGISGASPSTIAVSASGVSYDCFNFDSAITGYSQFKVKLADYNLGSLRAKFDWTTSGTGGGIVWGIQGIAVNDSGSFSAAWGAAQESFDSFITGTGLHQTSGTASFTLGGSVQSNSLLYFRVYRNVYHSSDTLAVNASLLGINIQYTGIQIQSW